MPQIVEAYFRNPGEFNCLLKSSLKIKESVPLFSVAREDVGGSFIVGEIAQQFEDTAASGGTVGPEQLEQQTRDVDSDYCSQLAAVASRHKLTSAETLNADQRGRFDVNLRPGYYLIAIRGLGHQIEANWYEFVDLNWRKHVRFVYPTCQIDW